MLIATRRLLSCFVVLTLLASAVAQQPGPGAQVTPAPLMGFSANASVAQRQWEQKFRDSISRENLRSSMQLLSARPHHVGSPYDRQNAEWMLSKFKEWGYEARIETFNVLFPTPKERVVELVQPTRFVARLAEPAVPGDPTSNQFAEQLPTYNAYSVDGDVTGPLVYVNYGMREDYEELAKMGISVKGAVVIARYGAAWRGIKPKVAAEQGAIGCIIYSDPQDDGYFNGDDYPKGGWRAKDSVQRGSVMDTDYPGDPLTPGIPATADAKRIAIKEAKTITRIPVLPISYADALPLLSAIDGRTAPEKWRGSLPITYHLGPGPAKVHLKVASNWDIKPVYNVIATLHGSTAPDEWVLRGNHHDAWVNGADDPVSGMVAVLEEARAIGELRKQGWNPRRTIIYCAWDGEEPGLLGSTEWVEAHRADLQQHAVAYINSDTNERGFFHASGSHDLERLINDVARDIPEPEKKMSVWQRAHSFRIARATNAEERNEVRDRLDLRIRALGDGSDYTAFLDHAGVSALNLGYGGEEEGDQYHSIYDDFAWYTRFMDPDFSYGRALAQTAGTAVMRLANAELIPFEYTNTADTMAKYIDELEKLLKDKQTEIAERNREVQDGIFDATADPKKTSVPPPIEPAPPYMNFAPLKNALENIKRASNHYSDALKQAQMNGGAALSQPAIAGVNQKLLAVQRSFLSASGLPERPWFKHQLYAPGAYTGYGAKPIAAVREYMDQKKWREAEAQIPVVSKIFEEAAAAINSAAAQLEAVTKPAR